MGKKASKHSRSSSKGRQQGQREQQRSEPVPEHDSAKDAEKTKKTKKMVNTDADYATPEEFVNMVEEKNPGMKNFLQTVREFVDTVWDFLQDNPKYLEANVLTRLVEPERMVQFRVPWLDDDGVVRVNRGFRVQFNSAMGPYKGGLRLHPTVTTDVLWFLAFEQTFKNALTTLPLGGGKGGSDFNPKGKSDNEVMRFCQSFMTELSKHIGPDTDVPAGDIGVGAREVGYLFGQYKRLRNEFSGILTGKPLLFGGSKLRTEATGYGVVYFVDHMLRKAQGGGGSDGESPLAGKTVTVSGSGNVAQFTVEKLIELGAKVVSMSDSGGTVFVEDGFDTDKLEAIKELKNVRRGRIKEFAKDTKGVEFREGATPWDIKCDVALPCATQNELDGDDADTLLGNGVQLVCEAANMPCTPEAVDKFLEKQILFGPAKAANAGGVAVSGLEMSQNSQRLHWTREEVDDKLRQIMENIHDTCSEHGTSDDGEFVNYVKGANVGAFKSVAEAMFQQGAV